MAIGIRTPLLPDTCMLDVYPGTTVTYRPPHHAVCSGYQTKVVSLPSHQHQPQTRRPLRQADITFCPTALTRCARHLLFDTKQPFYGKGSPPVDPNKRSIRSTSSLDASLGAGRLFLALAPLPSPCNRSTTTATPFFRERRKDDPSIYPMVFLNCSRPP